MQKTPMHLWIVGVVSLLWNALGAFDYLMTKTQNESYMAVFTPEQLEYFYAFPAWATATWAIAVWGAVVGSVLLLMRSRHAFPVFAVGFVAMFLTSIYNFGLSNGFEAMGGTGPLLFSALIFVIAAALVWYSRDMVKKGVLT
jgi:hypothetical protein